MFAEPEGLGVHVLESSDLNWVNNLQTQYLDAGDTVGPGKPPLLPFNAIIITIRSCRNFVCL